MNLNQSNTVYANLRYEPVLDFADRRVSTFLEKRSLSERVDYEYKVQR
jgi:hypothetical protein